MKKFALCFLALTAASFVAQAGPETLSGNDSKDVKQVMPAPCTEWYGDNEWNLSIWGTYAFTSENWESDRYLLTDHAWGGGADFKYFFHRYFGVGVEAFGLSANRRGLELAEDESSESAEPIVAVGGPHDSRLVGAVLGTFTLRFPLPCSRFAPYVYGGAGVIFGGGEHATFVDDDSDADADTTRISDSDTEFIGQIGGGFEFRLTRHIGFINDFSWNFVGRDNSDFGMVRAGLNFAF
jgi:opacity protein-like surface antigen